MDCPACGASLHQITVSDITVDVCKDGCGGIWFDNFELEKVDEKYESAGESLLNIKPESPVPIDSSKPRLCPKCPNIKMMRHFRSVKGEVQIDECPSCGGVWLDQGELGLIRNQFDNDEARHEAARAYFSNEFEDDLKQAESQNAKKATERKKFAKALRFICPSNYIPGKQDWGAF